MARTPPAVSASPRPSAREFLDAGVDCVDAGQSRASTSARLWSSSSARPTSCGRSIIRPESQGAAPGSMMDSREGRTRAGDQRHGPRLHGRARRSFRRRRKGAGRLSAAASAATPSWSTSMPRRPAKSRPWPFLRRQGYARRRHPHPCADRRWPILPGGTAYQSDAGMTGDYDWSSAWTRRSRSAASPARRRARASSPPAAPRPCAACLVETGATAWRNAWRRCGSAGFWGRRCRSIEEGGAAPFQAARARL